MELIERLGIFITNNGVALPIFGNVTPTEPSDVVTITDTGGYRPEKGSPHKHPTISITVRARAYEVARSTAQQIYDLFDSKEFLQIDADTVLSAVQPTQEPGWVGKDANERQLVVCNYILTIRR